MIDSANPRVFLPPGRVPGCLPRTSRPGQVCPLAAEHIEIVDRADWDAAAKELNNGLGLRPHVKVILDQDSAGSCATESSDGAVMGCRAVAGLPHILLNPWFVYHHTSHGRDNGSSIDENLEFIREKGIAPESVWPRSKGFRDTPSAEAYDAALAFRIEEFYDISNVNEFVSALLKGFFVVWGANGHSVLKVRHLDERKGEDANSWALTWGDNGFGVWASYAAINWAYGAWAVRTVRQS